MAKARSAHALGDIQRSVRQVQVAGERLAGRLQREARTLLSRGSTELTKDMRRLRRELRSRAGHMVRNLETRVVRQFHAATVERVKALEKRVATLERLTAAIERRLGASDT